MHLKPFFLFAVLALVTTAQAQTVSLLPLTQLRGDALDESVPFTLASWHGRPAVITLWQSDCSPCQRELQQLPALARTHPDLPMALLILDDTPRARAALAAAALPKNVEILITDADAHRILTAVGNTRQALPFSLALRRDGSACARDYGLLSPTKINQWIRTC